jgi:imidazolonepropionase-like amidohydrolase
MDLEALEAGAVEHAREALAGGLTTLRDLGSANGIAIRLRGQVAAGRVAGPRILAAGVPVTTTGGHCHWFSRRADSGPELVVAVEELAALGADVIKVMATGGMVTKGSDPYTAQYTAAQLTPAVQVAHRLGLRVAAHALCTAGVRLAIAAGVDTIEHGWTITGARQDFEPAVAGEIARSGAVGSVTTHNALRDLLPDADGAGGDIAEIRRRLVPHRALAAAGVPLVVHSDAGPGPTLFDDFAASVRTFALGMGATAEEAIRAATGTAARALGIDSDVGTIEPGRLADIIIVDGDASAHLPTRERIRRVILGGRTVALDGRVIS